MAANYGTGAWGEGNYSAPTASALAAAAGTYAETGPASGLVWQAKAAAAFGGFGLAGLSCVLRAAFAVVAASRTFGLTGGIAGLVWAAFAAASEYLFGLAGEAVSLSARWVVAAGTGMVASAGQNTGFSIDNIWIFGKVESELWKSSCAPPNGWNSIVMDNTAWRFE